MPRLRGLIPRPESRSTRVVRVLLIAALVTQLPLAVWSGYRAVVQVLELELHTPAVLYAGGRVSADVTSSARTLMTVTIELVQGARRVTLDSVRVGTHRDPALDPRTISRTVERAVTSADLVGFDPGEATVRVVATGTSQWLRTPPPSIREQRVQLIP